MTLSLPGVDLAYDLLGPDDGVPLFMIGQPMTAEGFMALAEQFSDRRVVLYDPRGLGRSRRSDGQTSNDPQVQAQDLHALLTELGGGPADVFASSGGAVAGLAWASQFPGDIGTLVAHEPPVLSVLPDAELAHRATAQVTTDYQAGGFGAGMASFIRLVSWSGEFTPEYFDAEPPNPAMFGLPTDDDGTRNDPLLSGASAAVTAYVPDIEALQASGTRIVLGAGMESGEEVAARCARALAARLGQEAVPFPSHHGGFGAEGGPMGGQPQAFAATLRQVLGG